MDQMNGPMNGPNDQIGEWTRNLLWRVSKRVRDDRVNRTQGGSVVEVEGSFDNWQSRQALHRSGNREFAIVKMLPPGVYQYKFIVDGEWKYAPDQPAMYDEMGNVNNVLEVQEYVPEILDSLDSFLVGESAVHSFHSFTPTHTYTTTLYINRLCLLQATHHH